MNLREIIAECRMVDGSSFWDEVPDCSGAFVELTDEGFCIVFDTNYSFQLETGFTYISRATFFTKSRMPGIVQTRMIEPRHQLAASALWDAVVGQLVA